MIDIEILTTILKELGFLDDSNETKDKEESSKDKPTTRPEQKEHHDEDKQA